jgi:hypothetical protein
MGPTEYDTFTHLHQMMVPDPVSETSHILNIPQMLHSAQHNYVIQYDYQNQMLLFEFVQNYINSSSSSFLYEICLKNFSKLINAGILFWKLDNILPHMI